MALNTGELVERFSKAPTKSKVIGLVFLGGIFGAVFYFMFYSDVADKAVNLGKRIVTLQQEKASYEDKQRRYNSFRAEVAKLLEEQKELLKVLPTDAEIPSFLQSLHAQAELAGLNILVFEQGAEQPQNFYATIPVKMELSGSYFQINKFFYSVGQLKRIVNIRDVVLSNPTNVEGEGSVMLKATFTASTFRFLAPPEPKGPPGAPPPPHG